MHLSGILKDCKRPELFHGPETLSTLEQLLPQYQNVLLFTGEAGFSLSGAAEFFTRYETKQHLHRFSYSGKALPIEDVERIYQNIDTGRKWDAVVAVGGGTVMDMAKIIAVAVSNRCQSVEEVITDKGLENNLHLIFIPTTAGTGSETTSFAVVYKNKRKLSIDRKTLLPHQAILDPVLLEKLSAEILNATVLDALAQAIESSWAKATTTESRRFSRMAIRLVLDNIEAKQSCERLEGLLMGSHLAGKAINITRTTLSHSISYPFTAHYGVPHGIAVFLTLAKVAELNFNANPENLQEGLEMSHIHETFSLLFDVFGVADIHV